MHEDLLDRDNNFQETIRKFSQECRLMASFYHPNVIRLLGLCLFEGSEVPLLVTEKLKMSVCDFMEDTPDSPLPLKVSILNDTCCGLDYLHSMPYDHNIIVHGGLTAKNVLLTSCMSAKITDFGYFRMVIFRPKQVTQTTDQQTNVYMPPEALDEHQALQPSVDVFSFGNLALFILTQVFPGNLLPATHTDLQSPDSVVRCTEVERREEYMKMLNDSFLESHPLLVELVTNCLQNNPDSRPSSEQLLEKLKRIKERIDKENTITKVSTTAHVEETTRMNQQIFPLQLDYQSGPDMPIAMDYGIQSVEINGTIYVGGGNTDKMEDLYIVMAFNMDNCIWHTLPPYSTKWFAITSVNNELVLVGGLAKGSASNEIGEWQADSKNWTFPFPPMSVTRISPSAISYKHWLVVAGGSRHGKCMNSVEVLDIDNSQWFTGSTTPTPWENKKGTTINDHWYLMGGWDGENFDRDIYYISLDDLVSHLESGNSSLWRKLPSLHCEWSSPVNSKGWLLAVGGDDYESGKSVSNIQAYVPESNSWVQAGELPNDVSECSCIKMSDNFLVIGGTDSNSRLKQFYTTIVL